MPHYIVEHLEPKLYPWCFLEYKHISKIVGKANLIFTNTKHLREEDIKKLKELGEVREESVTNMHLEKACILDPNAKITLNPEIAVKFDYFIFGGILGDNPPRARTTEYLTSKLNYPAFNLGKAQMSTDTAILVCKEIVDGKKLENLNFKDGVSIKVEKYLWEELPYRYLVKNGKVVFTPGLKKLLKELAKQGL